MSNRPRDNGREEKEDTVLESSDDASGDAAEACGSFVSPMSLPAGDAAASSSHGCAVEGVIFWVLLTRQCYGELLVEFEP